MLELLVTGLARMALPDGVVEVHQEKLANKFVSEPKILYSIAQTCMYTSGLPNLAKLGQTCMFMSDLCRLGQKCKSDYKYEHNCIHFTIGFKLASPPSRGPSLSKFLQVPFGSQFITLSHSFVRNRVFGERSQATRKQKALYLSYQSHEKLSTNIERTWGVGVGGRVRR